MASLPPLGLVIDSSRLGESFPSFEEFREDVELMELVCLEKQQQKLERELKVHSESSYFGRAVQTVGSLWKLAPSPAKMTACLPLIINTRKELEETILKRYQSREEFSARFTQCRELCNSPQSEKFISKILNTPFIEHFIDFINQRYEQVELLLRRTIENCIASSKDKFSKTVYLWWDANTTIRFLNIDAIVWSCEKPTPLTLSPCLYPLMQTVRVIEKREQWVKEAITMIRAIVLKGGHSDLVPLISQYCIDIKSLPQTIEQLHDEVGVRFVQKPDLFSIRFEAGWEKLGVPWSCKP